jgi:hypothetical protein
MSRSKVFSITIFVVTSLLSGYSVFNGMEGAASAIFSTGVTASVGLYANKQYQLRKEKEIK